MFKITRIAAITAGTAAVMAAAAVPSFANVSVASFGDNLAPNSTASTYIDSATRTLYVTTPSSSGINNTANDGVSGDKINTLTLSNIVGTAGIVHNADSSYTEIFGPGTLTFNNGTNLLTGSFTGAALNGFVGGGSLSLKSLGNNFTYQSGSYLGETGVLAGTNGSFAITFSGTDSGSGSGVQLDAASDGFASFVSNGMSGTFDAVGNRVFTPEPATTAAFSMGAFGILGLGLKARRRSAKSA